MEEKKRTIEDAYNEEYKKPMAILIPLIRDFLDRNNNFSNRWISRELSEKLFDLNLIDKKEIESLYEKVISEEVIYDFSYKK